MKVKFIIDNYGEYCKKVARRKYPVPKSLKDVVGSVDTKFKTITVNFQSHK